MKQVMELQEEKREMVGVDTGRVFRLGQPVRVRVLEADKISRTIDFVLAEDFEEET